MAKCVNCLFARAMPRPEIKTINVTSIVGAIEQNLANDLYDSQMENHLHRIKCHRYPETIIKDKQSFCGEYKDETYHAKHS